MSNYNKVKNEGVETIPMGTLDFAVRDDLTGNFFIDEDKFDKFISKFAKNIRKATLKDVLEFVGEVEYDENAEEENSGAYEYHARNAERQRIRDYIKTLTK